MYDSYTENQLEMALEIFRDHHYVTQKKLEPNVSCSRESVWKSGKEKVKVDLKQLVKVDRGVFRTLSNIQDRGFCKNNWWFDRIPDTPLAHLEFKFISIFT